MTRYDEALFRADRPCHPLDTCPMCNPRPVEMFDWEDPANFGDRPEVSVKTLVRGLDILGG